MVKMRTFETEQLATVYVAAIIEGLISAVEHPVLGLATGSTPVQLYRQLVAFHHQGLQFSHVTTVNLDEYVGLSADHPQSYRRFMHDHFFGHIDISPNQTFVPNGQASDLAAECARYDKILEVHPIDLQILGIGHNGHIGFNEPDQALQTKTHVVRLAEDTIVANTRFFARPEDVPTEAITMGIQSILQAKSIILMAFGRDKAAAVRQALSGEVSTSMPASFLQMHPQVTFVLDAEAAVEVNQRVNDLNPIYGTANPFWAPLSRSSE